MAAGRTQWQIPVLKLSAIVFVFIAADSVAPAAADAATISITSPANHSVVSGVVTIMTSEQSPIGWMNAFADTRWFVSDGASQPYWVRWDSTKVANGAHQLSVIGYNNANQVVSQSAVLVWVSNGTTSSPTPVPTIKPTPVPTPAPTAAPTAAPPISTPIPTKAPTPIPTSAPTNAPSSAPTATPAPAAGTTFYVSPSGSDSASGSSGAPWRTIQKAADTLNAGQTAIIAAGTYGERVRITRSGTQASPITLQVASGAVAKLLGFDITGNSWQVNGFDISTQTNGSDGFGIYVTGTASYVTLQTNYIHELCHEGIFMDAGVTHVSVLNNRIWRAEMAGVSADGTYDLIQGNEVWGTRQYPANAGGIYSGCTIAGGADADAFRFFGQHNTFRSNYAHDVVTDSGTNPNPHTDCFQTWGSTAMQVDDILIERNTCRWPLASTAVDAETAMIEGYDGPVGTVTFQ